MNSQLLTAWQWWDQIYFHLTRLEYVDKENNIFRVAFLPYHGETLYTNDGIMIQKGDIIAKLHIHNCRLAKELAGVQDDAALGIKMLQMIKRSLPGLAIFIKNHPMGDKIQACVGTTLLYRGADRLGFQVSALEEGLFLKYKSFYLKIMLQLCHPMGRERIMKNEHLLTAKRVYISKKALLERYCK